MCFLGLPVAMFPDIDQSTLKIVRSWYPVTVLSSRQRGSSPAVKPIIRACTVS